MKKTYLVEFHGGVIGLYKTLSDAKLRVNQLGGGVITMMRGDYFGEGYHVYKLELNNKVYKYIYRRF